MWLSATLCLLWAAGGTAGPLDDEIGICKQGRAQLGEIDLRAPATQSGVADDTDVLHYVLDIEIVPSSDWLGGTNTITVHSLIDGLTTFQIRLRDNFNITSVQVDGVPATWQRLSVSTIEVALSPAYDTGEEFDVLVVYDGQPVSQGFGSINFTSAGGSPLVFTLSEPWYAYTWWPAKDDNIDKATGEFKITVPDTLTVASNGLMLSMDDVGGSRLRYDWLTGYQTATYLFSFSAAHYNTFSDTYDYDGGSMPVDFFIFPDSDTPSNRDAWLTTVAMLPVFSDLFGLYPFIDEKYGIYQFAFGGGMEHQTMTGQGTFNERISAHELGHSWFGNMITCGTWQDIWLNEQRRRQRLRARRGRRQLQPDLLRQLQLPQGRMGRTPAAARCRRHGVLRHPCRLPRRPRVRQRHHRGPARGGGERVRQRPHLVLRRVGL
jgi:aminopeptidase N